ncbi:quinolinate synthase NadA [Amphiplicatus metriothermophilus]|uniref:Quinolinate synthase n=1 Tax=Amphiplicatus metriothermophilus TaxID=1519374 RepID=A0A239Q034_9PROT|nr:quinolinate synthase NadA [Amphiplicatus metriothermophilus]MBB5518298.1 quinolinate synthase [Amphiplicatus metriothermophilus]SNT75552.1 quinolinate synthetase [Amphiplicatus metriothermophilus]
MPAFGQEPAAPALPYTQAVKEATDHLYPRVAGAIPEAEWKLHAPYIAAINELKKKRGAVILAHNYMTPEIFRCVGDFAGDSLQLAKEAAKTDAKVIVQAGVHFMAETSKILCPDKTVLIPDLRAGCSLAASITAADVRLLKQKYPGVPVVTYVNTSAAVKAESDICCTSSNAVEVVEHICAERGSDAVIFLPDQYLARNVAAMTDIRVITWAGACEVHERFTAEDIREIREAHPGVVVLAHPECPPDVLAEADFAGSTSGMSDYVKENQPKNVVLITECSMSDNVALENPDVTFVRPCNLCPHMKRITLQGILRSLETMTHEVTVDPEVAARARRAIERMIALPLKRRSMYRHQHAPEVSAIEARV